MTFPYEKAKVRVKVGEFLTDWLPWITNRAGKDSSWFPLDIDEQVVIFSPSGELSLGAVLAIYDCRCGLGYKIDGVVFKLNNLKLHNKLGNTNTAPRWAIAYKFPATCGKTQLKRILIQVGRTGVLTPLAELVPINVGGVLISRASLHNYDEIKRKDIREGDIVTVIRAGDVIPYIAEVDKNSRLPNTLKFVFPQTCPECGSRVEKVDGEAAIRCSGEFTCKGQIIEKLKHFVSPEAFNITGFSDKHVESFYNLGLIEQISDIFTLENRLSQFNLQE